MCGVQIVRQLREETKTLTRGKMATLIDQLPVMAMLARAIQAKNIVDLGTFTGISALHFALVTQSNMILCDDGVLTAVDIS